LPAPTVNGGGDTLGKVTLTLDRVVWHTVAHQSSTFIYIPNFNEIGKKLISGWTNCRDPLQVQGHMTQKVGQI